MIKSIQRLFSRESQKFIDSKALADLLLHCYTKREENTLFTMLSKIKEEKAAGNPDFEKVKHCFNAVDPLDNSTPLWEACKHKRYAIVTLLLDLGANPNYRHPQQCLSLLDFMIQEKSYRLLQLLIRFGADVTTCISPIHSLIHQTWCDDVANTIDLLMEKGVDVNQRDDRGFTSLIHACGYYGSVEKITFLMSRGAQFVESFPFANEICMASFFNHTEIVWYLLSTYPSKIDVNTCFVYSGATPIMFAAAENNIELFRMLETAGADLWAKSKENKVFNAFQYAYHHRSDLIIAHLESRYGEEECAKYKHTVPDISPSNVDHVYSTTCAICKETWTAPHVVITRGSGARIYCKDCITGWLNTSSEKTDPATREPIIEGPHPLFN